MRKILFPRLHDASELDEDIYWYFMLTKKLHFTKQQMKSRMAYCFLFHGKTGKMEKTWKKIPNLNTIATLTLTKFCVHIPIMEEVIQTKMLSWRTRSENQRFILRRRGLFCPGATSVLRGINPQPGLDSSCRETQPAWCHCTPPFTLIFILTQQLCK